MPRVIGLTGGIASGKSLVSRTLQGLGMIVIDADDVSHELMAKDEVVRQKVVETFGTEVLTEAGAIDRGKLAAIVFRDQERRQALEQIMHPGILAQLSERARGAKTDVVLDIPLLIEQGGDKGVNLVVVVYATRECQIQRLMARDGISREEAIRRVDAQLPLEEKIAYADYVINNSGTEEETVNQVTRFYKLIKGKERS
jgi:dephospho-CoA kinase